MWCSLWPRRYACTTRFLPHLRCLLQAPTTPVAGAAEACRLRQDRAHTTRDEASEPALATKFAQHSPSSDPSAKKLAQHSPSSGPSAKKLAQQAQKRRNWGVLSPLGELFRAHTHHQAAQGELFRARTQPRGDIETNTTTAPTHTGHRETTITTARPRTATIETGGTSATKKHATNTHFSPAKVVPVSTPRENERAKATSVSRERCATPTRIHMPVPQKTRMQFDWVKFQ